jgi:hypothetical protein
MRFFGRPLMSLKVAENVPESLPMGADWAHSEPQFVHFDLMDVR